MTTMRIVRANGYVFCAECGTAMALEFKAGVYSAEPEKKGFVWSHIYRTGCIHDGVSIRIPAETGEIVEVK